MADKWISNSPWKRCGYGKPICFSTLLAWASVPKLHLEFQFTATVFVSMATRLSNLDEQKPGTSIQKEVHTLTTPCGWNGPEDPEVFGSTPSQSSSQSLVRKPDCHETWYCLEIHVVSTKDERAVPPPSHTWQAPIAEDMV